MRCSATSCRHAVPSKSTRTERTGSIEPGYRAEGWDTAPMRDRSQFERVATFIPDAWRRRVASCGGSAHDVDGLVVCLTGVPLAPFNPTLVAAVPADPDDAVAKADRVYDGTGLAIGIDMEASLHRLVRTA